MIRYKTLLLWISFLASISSSSFASEIHGCRPKIEEKLCIVDPPKIEADRYKDGRQCLPDSRRYLDQILTSFDTYPNFIKDAFCSIQRIYIEKDFFGSAWSAPISETISDHALLGLSQKYLDAQLPLSHYLTWFNQLTFGGKPNYEISDNLPQYKVSGSSNTTSAVTFTLLHEVGHILDYANRYTEPGSDTWAAIAWDGEATPKPDFDFPLRQKICLNNCNGNYLDAASAETLYRSLYGRGFVSQLAALNVREDFAESFAVYIASRYLSIQFALAFENGVKLPLSLVLESPVYSPKLQYLEKRFGQR